MSAKINFFYNFSSLQLSDAAKSLLNKGLNFCPTPKGINTTQLFADMFRMERKFAANHFFRNKNSEPKVNEKYPFSSKNTNLPYEYPNEIKEFVTAVKSELLGTEFEKVHHNLTVTEREALEELLAQQKLGRIVIQPADKGSGICIYDREDYEAEAERQLNDTLEDALGQKHNYYRKVDEKMVKAQYKLIKDTLDEGVERKYITKDFAKQLLPEEPKAGSLCLLWESPYRLGRNTYRKTNNSWMLIQYRKDFLVM